MSKASIAESFVEVDARLLAVAGRDRAAPSGGAQSLHNPPVESRADVGAKLRHRHRDSTEPQQRFRCRQLVGLVKVRDRQSAPAHAEAQKPRRKRQSDLGRRFSRKSEATSRVLRVLEHQQTGTRVRAYFAAQSSGESYTGRLFEQFGGGGDRPVSKTSSWQMICSRSKPSASKSRPTPPTRSCTAGWGERCPGCWRGAARARPRFPGGRAPRRRPRSGSRAWSSQTANRNRLGDRRKVDGTKAAATNPGVRRGGPLRPWSPDSRVAHARRGARRRPGADAGSRGCARARQPGVSRPRTLDVAVWMFHYEDHRYGGVDSSARFA